MGPWGFTTFEDELACDWLEDLVDSDPIAFFRQCLDLSDCQEVGYLAGIGVLCTSEIIHSLCDRPRDGLPRAVHGWLRNHRHLNVASLLEDAIAGMQRVLEPTSELWERWEDNEEWGDEWFRHSTDLLQRLEDDLRSWRFRGPRSTDHPPNTAEFDDDSLS